MVLPPAQTHVDEPIEVSSRSITLVEIPSDPDGGEYIPDFFDDAYEEDVDEEIEAFQQTGGCNLEVRVFSSLLNLTLLSHTFSDKSPFYQSKTKSEKVWGLWWMSLC